MGHCFINRAIWRVLNSILIRRLACFITIKARLGQANLIAEHKCSPEDRLLLRNLLMSKADKMCAVSQFPIGKSASALYSSRLEINILEVINVI